jgi:hypothetical protein
MEPKQTEQNRAEATPIRRATELVRGENSFPTLDQEPRELVPTDCAAYHLNRRPQTLREWSCLGSGLLSPVRIGARLGWRTADLRRIVKGASHD